MREEERERKEGEEGGRGRREVGRREVGRRLELEVRIAL
jgi:hypothetical protein